MEIIKKADTASFVTKSPISLIYLNYDSTVTNRNSMNACSSDGITGESGMINCIAVDNSQLYSAVTLGKIETESSPFRGFDLQLGLMMDHASAAYLLQLIALNQIEQAQ